MYSFLSLTKSIVQFARSCGVLVAAEAKHSSDLKEVVEKSNLEIARANQTGESASGLKLGYLPTFCRHLCRTPPPRD